MDAFELAVRDLNLRLMNPREARAVRHAVRKRLPADANLIVLDLAGVALSLGTLRNLTTEITHFVWERRPAQPELSFAYAGLAEGGLARARQVAAEPLRSLVERTSGAAGLIAFTAGSWDGRYGERDRLFAAIARRDQSRCCAWCGADAAVCPKGLTLDHLLPRALGGSYEAGNLIISCQACNSSRGALCPRKWSRQLRGRNVQPNPAVVGAALVRYEQLKRAAQLPVATMTAAIASQAA